MPITSSTTQDCLTGAAVERFRANGFLRGPRVLDAEGLNQARQAFDRIASEASPGMKDLFMFRRSGDPRNLQVHAVGLWRAEPALRELALHPVIARCVAVLMGVPAVRLFRDQLFFKPARSSGIVPWHQDYSDWSHTRPASHITCWMALDNATVRSGCLHYGGSISDVLPKIDRTDDMQSAFARLPESVHRDFRPEPVEVRAGSCVFHHCLTIHGSYGNHTDRPRRAIAIAYMHPETRSTSTRPVVPGGPVFADGAIIAGELFPIVCRP